MIKLEVDSVNSSTVLRKIMAAEGIKCGYDYREDGTVKLTLECPQKRMKDILKNWKSGIMEIADVLEGDVSPRDGKSETVEDAKVVDLGCSDPEPVSPVIPKQLKVKKDSYLSATLDALSD